MQDTVVLGIDPGSHRIGYGVVKKDRLGYHFVRAGIFTLPPSKPLERIREVHREMRKLLRAVRPQTVAMEKLYFSNNQKTAIAVAEARGVLLLATREAGCAFVEFTPTEVKKHVTGYGRADKKAVEKMVRLRLRVPTVTLTDDAVDALAVALSSL